MSLQIIKIDVEKHQDLLAEFCLTCQQLNYNNNTGLDKLKLQGPSDLPNLPVYWALTRNNRIHSLSGCFKINDTDSRCLFRSATVEKFSPVKSLSKTHMNSVPFSLLLPCQIFYGLEQGCENFFITTSNSDHDASGRMNRTHRALILLSKLDIVEFVKNDFLFNTSQTVWKINLNNYYNALMAFDRARSELNIIGFEDVYQQIKQSKFRV